ncbi:hypothetical protein TOPB45_0359 [Thermodesulfobacterium geofontis OPF15]|uniref:Uncharacterized protein n=1 Tax=Thermodesulfobacterium geofontis (strain OPF15) TaxID=795359 RepID=F8C3L6_THEGP|nr:hypothetical protein TOPB45_0359 [Thermodesulfobacterium geofontis OPF15]
MFIYILDENWATCGIIFKKDNIKANLICRKIIQK